MAASSSSVIPVLPKAFEDPDNIPNFYLVKQLPETPVRDSYYYVNDTTLHYFNPAGESVPITILNKSAFTKLLKENMEGRSSKKLSSLIIHLLITGNTNFVLKDLDTQAREFVMKIYGPNYIQYDKNKSSLYFAQLNQLRDELLKLIPFYYAERKKIEDAHITDNKRKDYSHNQEDAVDNVNDFFRKIQFPEFRDAQTNNFFVDLKLAIEFNLFIYSQKNYKDHLNSFVELCKKIGFCPAGSATHFLINYSELKGLCNPSIETARWMTALRNSIFDQVIAQFIINEDLSDGMKVHLNPHFLQMAYQQGFNVDNAIRTTLTAMHDRNSSDPSLRITPATLPWFKAEFLGRFNRTAIIDCIVLEFFSRLSQYKMSDEINYGQLIENIETGLLAPLFKLQNRRLQIPFMLLKGSDKRRLDFPRNLRQHVEQYLIEAGFISEQRTIKLSFKLNDSGLEINLHKTGATDLELNNLRFEILKKIQSIEHTITQDECAKVIAFSENLPGYYTILLGLSDILNEFDVDITSLQQVLEQLVAIQILDAKDAQFITRRLNPTAFYQRQELQFELGIKPVMVISTLEEAMALLQWDEEFDMRSPEYLTQARHVSGLSVIEWAIQKQQLPFLSTLLLSNCFDPEFDPDNDVGFLLTPTQKEQIFSRVENFFYDPLVNNELKNSVRYLWSFKKYHPYLFNFKLTQILERILVSRETLSRYQLFLDQMVASIRSDMSPEDFASKSDEMKHQILFNAIATNQLQLLYQYFDNSLPVDLKLSLLSFAISKNNLHAIDWILWHGAINIPDAIAESNENWKNNPLAQIIIYNSVPGLQLLLQQVARDKGDQPAIQEPLISDCANKIPASWLTTLGEKISLLHSKLETVAATSSVEKVTGLSTLRFNEAGITAEALLRLLSCGFTIDELEQSFTLYGLMTLFKNSELIHNLFLLLKEPDSQNLKRLLLTQNQKLLLKVIELIKTPFSLIATPPLITPVVSWHGLKGCHLDSLQLPLLEQINELLPNNPLSYLFQCGYSLRNIYSTHNLSALQTLLSHAQIYRDYINVLPETTRELIEPAIRLHGFQKLTRNPETLLDILPDYDLIHGEQLELFLSKKINDKALENLALLRRNKQKALNIIAAGAQFTSLINDYRSSDLVILLDNWDSLNDCILAIEPERKNSFWSRFKIFNNSVREPIRTIQLISNASQPLACQNALVLCFMYLYPQDHAVLFADQHTTNQWARYILASNYQLGFPTQTLSLKLLLKNTEQLLAYAITLDEEARTAFWKLISLYNDEQIVRIIAFTKLNLPWLTIYDLCQMEPGDAIKTLCTFASDKPNKLQGLLYAGFKLSDFLNLEKRHLQDFLEYGGYYIDFLGSLSQEIQEQMRAVLLKIYFDHLPEPQKIIDLLQFFLIHNLAEADFSWIYQKSTPTQYALLDAIADASFRSSVTSSGFTLGELAQIKSPEVLYTLLSTALLPSLNRPDKDVIKTFILQIEKRPELSYLINVLQFEFPSEIEIYLTQYLYESDVHIVYGREFLLELAIKNPTLLKQYIAYNFGISINYIYLESLKYLSEHYTQYLILQECGLTLNDLFALSSVNKLRHLVDHANAFQIAFFQKTHDEQLLIIADIITTDENDFYYYFDLVTKTFPEHIRQWLNLLMNSTSEKARETRLFLCNQSGNNWGVLDQLYSSSVDLRSLKNSTPEFLCSFLEHSVLLKNIIDQLEPDELDRICSILKQNEVDQQTECRMVLEALSPFRDKTIIINALTDLYLTNNPERVPIINRRNVIDGFKGSKFKGKSILSLLLCGYRINELISTEHPWTFHYLLDNADQYYVPFLQSCPDEIQASMRQQLLTIEPEFFKRTDLNLQFMRFCSIVNPENITTLKLNTAVTPANVSMLQLIMNYQPIECVRNLLNYGFTLRQLIERKSPALLMKLLSPEEQSRFIQRTGPLRTKLIEELLKASSVVEYEITVSSLTSGWSDTVQHFLFRLAKLSSPQMKSISQSIVRSAQETPEVLQLLCDHGLQPEQVGIPHFLFLLNNIPVLQQFLHCGFTLQQLLNPIMSDCISALFDNAPLLTSYILNQNRSEQTKIRNEILKGSINEISYIVFNIQSEGSLSQKARGFVNKFRNVTINKSVESPQKLILIDMARKKPHLMEIMQSFGFSEKLITLDPEDLKALIANINTLDLFLWQAPTDQTSLVRTKIINCDKELLAILRGFNDGMIDIDKAHFLLNDLLIVNRTERIEKINRDNIICGLEGGKFPPDATLILLSCGFNINDIIKVRDPWTVHRLLENAELVSKYLSSLQNMERSQALRNELLLCTQPEVLKRIDTFKKSGLISPVSMFKPAPDAGIAASSSWMAPGIPGMLM